MEIISQKDAVAKGMDVYYTGRPCSRGHYSPRNAVTGACLACVKTYQRTYQAERRRLLAIAKHSAMAGDAILQYRLHADDLPAALAYCQGLDIQRGRIPSPDSTLASPYQPPREAHP